MNNPNAIIEWVAMALGGIVVVYLAWIFIEWLWGLFLSALPFLIVVLVLGGIGAAFNSNNKSQP